VLTYLWIKFVENNFILEKYEEIDLTYVIINMK